MIPSLLGTKLSQHERRSLGFKNKTEEKPETTG